MAPTNYSKQVQAQSSTLFKSYCRDLEQGEGSKVGKVKWIEWGSGEGLEGRGGEEYGGKRWEDCSMGCVCINVWGINWLYVIDTYLYHTTFSFGCHFQQCPWDLGSVPVERACRTGGGGLVHLKGANCMAASELRWKKPLVGTGWAISLLLSTKWA